MSEKPKNPGLSKSMKSLEKTVLKILEDIRGGRLTGPTARLNIQAAEMAMKFEGLKGRQLKKAGAGARWAGTEEHEESQDERQQSDGRSDDQARLN